MKRATVTLPDDLADLVDREARRRQTSFSSLFHDPEMVPAERLDEELADHWADDIDRDRG
jgi:hypothetical protein